MKLTPLADDDGQIITLLKYILIIIVWAIALLIAPLCILCPPLDKLVWGDRWRDNE